MTLSKLLLLLVLCSTAFAQGVGGKSGIGGKGGVGGGAIVSCGPGVEKKSDYANISTSPNTLATTIFGTGDLVAIAAWCFPTATNCSGTAPTVTLGSQSATLVTGFGTPTQSDTGEGFIFYVLSTTAGGSPTLTLSGTGATQWQVAYVDFAPPAGCTYSFVKATARGAGTSTTANLPSITPTNAGDTLFVFTWVSGHVTSVNSPWSCVAFTGSGQTGDCSFDGSRNADGWIVNSTTSPTANNMTNIHPTDDWEGMIVEFQP